MLIQEKYDRMDILTYGNDQRREGKKEGESKLATLITKLFSLGRGAEVEKVASDEQYRAKIFQEFKIL